MTAIVLPKVEEPGFVREVADAVAELEAARGLPHGGVRLVLQVETPAALPAFPPSPPPTRAWPRSRSGRRISAPRWAACRTGLSSGPNYAVLSPRARRASCRSASWAASVTISDIPAFAERARRARRMGFRGALVVHPSQVGPLNDGLRADGRGGRLGAARGGGGPAARAEGRGAFQVDGRMVDLPVVRRAEEILALAPDAA